MLVEIIDHDVPTVNVFHVLEEQSRVATRHHYSIWSGQDDGQM